MPKGQETPRKGAGSKIAAAERRRLFVAAYIANGRNGREAARDAGYQGTEHALAVTASRLLKRADIRNKLAAYVDRAEAGLKASEIIERLSNLARLPDTEMVDIFDFVELIGADRAVEGVVASQSLEEAKAVVKMAGHGFYIDLEKARTKGLGKLVKKITHDRETGAPILELHDHNGVRELARRALKDLAEIRGLTRDQPPPPPPPNLTLQVVLHTLPTPLLAALTAHMEAEASKRQALPTEAKRA